MPGRLALAAALALALAGCAKGIDEQAAYEACLAAAKKEPKYAKATDKQADGGYKVTF